MNTLSQKKVSQISTSFLQQYTEAWKNNVKKKKTNKQKNTKPHPYKGQILYYAVRGNCATALTDTEAETFSKGYPQKELRSQPEETLALCS